MGWFNSDRKTKKHEQNRLSVERLEDREVMAAAIVQGSLIYSATSGNDYVEVNQISTDTQKNIEVRLNGRIDYSAVMQKKDAEGAWQTVLKSMTIDTGAGNDFVLADISIPTTIRGGAGDDVLLGSSSIDKIFGGDGRDFINGNGGPDVLLGGIGDDTLIGGQGFDFIQGEDGNDLLGSFQIVKTGQWVDDTQDDTIYGGNGNDTINGGSGADRLQGDAGIDVMQGGQGADIVSGNNGDDAIKGGTGNDTLFGGTGNDRIQGEEDNDLIYGRNGEGVETWYPEFDNDTLLGNVGDDALFGQLGDDLLQGGIGKDALYGELGNDTLIGIDGGFADLLDGGGDQDWIWRDANSVARDFASAETVQNVDQFSNTADRTLDGDSLADPTIIRRDDKGNPLPSYEVYRRFSGMPLFSSTGPNIEDIDQNILADCWMLGSLAGLTFRNPNAIRNLIVEFGDGTFGVKLGGKFFRVDADLPVTHAGSTTLAFAGVGLENSLWVALVEKAYAFYHPKDSGNYIGLEWGYDDHAMQAFGLSTGIDHAEDLAMPMVFRAAQQFDAGRVVTISFHRDDGQSGIANGFSFRHTYTVTGVVRDQFGIPTGLIVRNPWGPNETAGNPYSIVFSLFAFENTWIRYGA